MNYASPRTPMSGPVHGWEHRRMSSATPSPQHHWQGPATPQRPATRAAYGHVRSTSCVPPSSYTPRPSVVHSPRYNSKGEYAATVVDVSSKRSSSKHRPSASAESHPRRDRRHSCTYVRTFTPYGESDEDEIIETLGGRTFVLPAQTRFTSVRHTPLPHDHDSRRYTNCDHYVQTPRAPPNSFRDPVHFSEHNFSVPFDPSCDAPYDVPPYETPPPAYQERPPTAFRERPPTVYRERPPTAYQERPPSAYRERPPTAYQERPPTGHSRSRRPSLSVPKRPSTVRPAAAVRTTAAVPPQKSTKPRVATQADARENGIPPGFSLKNWDPNEEPILILGSVFDHNSLGKWIYDWTRYWQTPASDDEDDDDEKKSSPPLVDVAADLWLLLIQFAGRYKDVESVAGYVRNPKKRETMRKQLSRGDRIMDDLRALLKCCETSMLNMKDKESGLGVNSGLEFVRTLFSPDREMDNTNKFMASLQYFIDKFDQDCARIVEHPTK